MGWGRAGDFACVRTRVVRGQRLGVLVGGWAGEVGAVCLKRKTRTSRSLLLSSLSASLALLLLPMLFLRFVNIGCDILSADALYSSLPISDSTETPELLAKPVTRWKITSLNLYSMMPFAAKHEKRLGLDSNSPDAHKIRAVSWCVSVLVVLGCVALG